jgi:inner membrane protein
MHPDDTLPPPLAAAAPQSWRPSLASPMLRLALLVLLLLVLNIPLGMVRGVVEERAERRNEAVQDILTGWGGEQRVVGPLLLLPYITHTQVVNSDGKTIQQTGMDTMYFLPRELHIEGRLDTELRHRGIFEVPVYGAALRLAGQFDAPDFAALGISPADLDWKHAELVLGLAEPRTLHADAALDWNGKPLRFKPSTARGAAWAPSGIHVPLGQELSEVLGPGGAAFSIQLSFNGADAISFTPTAEQTDVSLSANWPHPSFRGTWLPVRHELGAQGFTAQWSVSYLGRDYPQHWTEAPNFVSALGKSQFGVSLAQPVDPYVMAERVLKYAVLTLVFTFAVIWLTEVLSGQTVHPVQYAFVGAALCLFGLLQLSFAEHFGFTVAFAVAAAAVVGMITLYSLSLLRRAWQALTVGGILGGLYAYLYAILRAEDHALLGGSVALFVGLGAAMYLTRAVDWHGLGRRPLGARPVAGRGEGA